MEALRPLANQTSPYSGRFCKLVLFKWSPCSHLLIKHFNSRLLQQLPTLVTDWLILVTYYIDSPFYFDWWRHIVHEHIKKLCQTPNIYTQSITSSVEINHSICGLHTLMVCHNSDLLNYDKHCFDDNNRP